MQFLAVRDLGKRTEEAGLPHGIRPWGSPLAIGDVMVTECLASQSDGAALLSTGQDVLALGNHGYFSLD